MNLHTHADKQYHWGALQTAPPANTEPDRHTSQTGLAKTDRWDKSDRASKDRADKSDRASKDRQMGQVRASKDSQMGQVRASKDSQMGQVRASKDRWDKSGLAKTDGTSQG